MFLVLLFSRQAAAPQLGIFWFWDICYNECLGEKPLQILYLHGAGELPPALSACARSDPTLNFQIQGVHLEQNPCKDITESLSWKEH